MGVLEQKIVTYRGGRNEINRFVARLNAEGWRIVTFTVIDRTMWINEYEFLIERMVDGSVQQQERVRECEITGRSL